MLMEREIQRGSRKYNSLCNLRFYLFHFRKTKIKDNLDIYTHTCIEHICKNLYVQALIHFWKKTTFIHHKIENSR